MTTQYITSINHTNKDKVLLLIEASLQAYNAFNHKHPSVYQKDCVTPPSKDYEFVDYWTGIDSLFTEDKTVEVYGVIFRTTKAPHKYIFAFRGTASILDILDDLGVDHSKFVAFDKTVEINKEVKVESGFNDIYTESHQSTQSMQTQLFEYIDKYQSSDKPIDELYITGHSLGSSLCQLFSLDVALSRPEIKASNINFACPRTGNQDFVDLYNAQPAQQNPLTQTLRIQNTYDKVPCVPLQAMDYSHTNYALLVAFYKDEWLGEANLLSCHSALNYQAVLKCAAESPDGVCTNHDLPVPGNGKHYAVKSLKPDAKTVCSLW